MSSALELSLGPWKGTLSLFSFQISSLSLPFSSFVLLSSSYSFPDFPLVSLPFPPCSETWTQLQRITALCLEKLYLKQTSQGLGWGCSLFITDLQCCRVSLFPLAHWPLFRNHLLPPGQVILYLLQPHVSLTEQTKSISQLMSLLLLGSLLHHL